MCNRRCTQINTDENYLGDRRLQPAFPPVGQNLVFCPYWRASVALAQDLAITAIGHSQAYFLRQQRSRVIMRTSELTMRRLLDNLIPTSSGERFPALDGLRGLAILGILTGHISVFGGLPPNLPGTGPMGVIILFALSAFLLYLPMARRNSFPLLKRYYLRRCIRIYPLYIIALVVTVALIPKTWDFTATELLANLSLVQTFVGTWNKAINPTLWFLVPLIHFYLLFPLLAWLCLRNKFVLPFLISLALAAQGFRGFYPPYFPTHLNWPVLALPFLAGMLAAQIATSKHNGFPALGPIGLTGLLIFALHIHPRVAQFAGVTDYLLNMRGPVITLCAFFTILGCLSLFSTFSRMLSVTPLRFVGMVGYGTYLFHYSARAILYRAFGEIACIILTIPLSISIGFLAYLYIEAPIIRRARKPPQDQPQTQPPAAQLKVQP